MQLFHLSIGANIILLLILLFRKTNIDHIYKFLEQERVTINKSLESLTIQVEKLENKERSLESEVKVVGSLNKLMYSEIKEGTEQLKIETRKLVNIFQKTNTRGKWGEVQLKRIAEMTGMLPYCEYELQMDFGDKIPDMVLKLPNEGLLFIDSKVPFEAYLKSLNSSKTEDEGKIKKENSKLVRTHISNLSKKKYWSEKVSPEMVVMFIPVEQIWLDAVDADPSLMEYATSQDVVVATPMTLIGLFKVISYGWKHVNLARESESIKTMLDEATVFFRDMSKILISSMKKYEEARAQLNNGLILNNAIADKFSRMFIIEK